MCCLKLREIWRLQSTRIFWNVENFELIGGVLMTDLSREIMYRCQKMGGRHHCLWGHMWPFVGFGLIVAQVNQRFFFLILINHFWPAIIGKWGVRAIVRWFCLHWPGYINANTSINWYVYLLMVMFLDLELWFCIVHKLRVDINLREIIFWLSSFEIAKSWS